MIKKPPTGRLSLEVSVFRKHYDYMQEGFQSPGVLAGKLYARGVIDEEVRDRAQSPFTTPIKKSQILLNAVEQAIKSDTQHFNHFLDILAGDPITKPLYKRLWESYGKNDTQSYKLVQYCTQVCNFGYQQAIRHVLTLCSINTVYTCLLNLSLISIRDTYLLQVLYSFTINF